MTYPYDNSRCPGYLQRLGNTHPLCLTCLRYLSRNDTGPHTLWVQGEVKDKKCELYDGVKE